MARDWQLVVDAGDPHVLADFWAEALGYRVEQNADLIQELLAAGRAQESDIVVHRGVVSWSGLAAICHPDDVAERQKQTGSARRILFQQVPESKAGKNRVHIDISVGPDALAPEVARLQQLGAIVLAEQHDFGSHFFTMADLEGNEFDVQ